MSQINYFQVQLIYTVVYIIEVFLLNCILAKFILINTQTLSGWHDDLLFCFTGTKKIKSGNQSKVLNLYNAEIVVLWEVRKLFCLKSLCCPVSVVMCRWYGFVFSNSLGSEEFVRGFSIFVGRIVSPHVHTIWFCCLKLL